MKIKKFVTPVSQGNISGLAAVIFSLLFIGVGFFILHLCELVPLPIIEILEQKSWWMIQLPNSSVPRWTLAIVGAIFSLAGISVLLQGIIQVRSTSVRKKRASFHHQSPWLWDFDWKYGKNLTKAKTPWWSHVIGLTIILGFHAIVWSIAAKENFKGAVLLFPIGMILFTFLIGIMFYINWRRENAHSKVNLQLSEFPLHLQSAFKIHLSGINSKIVKSLTLTLRAVEESYSYSKNKSSVKCHIRYSEEKEISVENGLVTIEFELPQTIHLSTKLSERPATFWELHVYSNCEGPDLDKNFYLPIY